jgi:hypothetical protein
MDFPTPGSVKQIKCVGHASVQDNHLTCGVSVKIIRHWGSYVAEPHSEVVVGDYKIGHSVTPVTGTIPITWPLIKHVVGYHMRAPGRSRGIGQDKIAVV